MVHSLKVDEPVSVSALTYERTGLLVLELTVRYLRIHTLHQWIYTTIQLKMMIPLQKLSIYNLLLDDYPGCRL